MQNGDSRSRRDVLASISVAASGSVIAEIATADDRDPSEYDRPRTVSENGVEITKWDCSRVLIDGDPDQVGTIRIGVEYVIDYWRDELETQTAMDSIEIGYPELPEDINTNEYVPEAGAYADADRLSYVIIYMVSVADHAGRTVAELDWPTEEWDCREMMDATVER
ncbi:hypothetical protein [Natronorubrum sulfidifaciens]|uniref:Uncharacterized protein n=1 Tax=Natronorubrum sulfidifaciens JCM 14089 TaxID=1230460 RepID=L9WCQ9_9EURY|nr:hypothetical protein [Natronorubrum sulfidifaciens]ELY47285.1 hypothetical protein C495_03467 [Natronorubrum sulfidifaciens JCM 14089]